MASLWIDKQAFQAFENTMKRLDIAVRSKAAKAVLRKSGNVFAKEYRAKIHRGDPNATPNLKPLHKLISTKVVDYNNGVLVAVSGVRKNRVPGEGVYHHIVEGGFKHYGTKAKIPGKPELIKADIRTRGARNQVLKEELAKVINEAAR